MLGLSLVTGVDAQPSFTIPLVVDFEDPRYGAFHARVEAGLQGSIVDGRLVAEASQPPGGCRLSTSTLIGEGTVASFVHIASEVLPEQRSSELPSGAGLIIRYAVVEKDPVHEVRFQGIFLRDGEYRVMSYENGEFTERLRGPVTGGPSVLFSAREKEGGAEFFVDAVHVGSVSDIGFDGSAVGLIHCGSGRFQFDTWGLNTRGDVGFDEAAIRTEESRDAESVEPSGAMESAATGELSSEPLTGSAEESAEVSSTFPPPLPGAEWWIEDRGQPSGPITLTDLRSRLADGRATPETLVWREGMSDWAPAAEALP